MNETEIRAAVKKAGVDMLRENLVQGTWGNISIRLDATHMVVTPSGLDYIRLTPEDMVVVDINTLEYTSKIKPTSEKKIHAAVYRARPEINAVIHSHPQYASSVAAARATLPVMSEEMNKAVGGDASCGEYGLPGTKGLMEATVAALGTRNACLMANHGLLVCGKSIEEAFDVCRIMEASAKAFIERRLLEITSEKEFSLQLLGEYFAHTMKN